MDDSACIGMCQIDPDTDTCIGCGRTGDDIFGPAADEGPPPATGDKEQA